MYVCDKVRRCVPRCVCVHMCDKVCMCMCVRFHTFLCIIAFVAATAGPEGQAISGHDAQGIRVVSGWLLCGGFYFGFRFA